MMKFLPSDRHARCADILLMIQNICGHKLLFENDSVPFSKPLKYLIIDFVRKLSMLFSVMIRLPKLPAIVSVYRLLLAFIARGPLRKILGPVRSTEEK